MKGLHRETVVVSPSWKAVLAAQGLNTIEGVYASRQGEAVTQSGSTEVRRLTLNAPGNPVVYIKKYWVRRPKQVWSGFFRGTVLGKPKAQREYENLGLLQSWGLGAPAPVAWGEERRNGAVMRSFLISEGVPEGQQLDKIVQHWLPAQIPETRRQWRAELVTELAKHTRQLHANRFCHYDHFWRNIILSRQSPRRFWLIDSHKGRVWKGWAERQSRARDLAALDAVAPRFFRRTERLRFLLIYLGRERLDSEAKALARSVLEAARPLRVPQLLRLGIGEEPRGRTGQSDLHVAEPFRAAFAEMRLTSLESLGRYFLPADAAQKTGVAVVPGELRLGSEPTPVYFKQYTYVPPAWKFLGRRSKALREVESYAAFRQLGIPCAEPIAWGEQRDALGRLQCAVILTGAIPGAVPLTEFFAQRQSNQRTWAVLRLAELTRRIHDAEFYHHDLVWRNILVNTHDGRPSMWWIDCPRGGYDHSRIRSARKRVKDLASLDKSAALHATFRERVRFLRAYLGVRKLDANARAFGRRVIDYRRTRWPEDWTGV